ncbi:MAG: 3-[(3aS,4S,7aS)-7a-methyl-1,5-dioxo-octahydro-1H-inden-4-yl]propanoyl:CoA ligase [Acidobacteria bacterium]|nr:3-[(3aS,4S,7aS)-7a-methyl-1,5-dioxo-octahydro-1H-inden-4-yl]propanoyl:CoA ligase [Acidobacteriota bacterium]
MNHQHPPYRDVTVGALLTRLAEALPDNEALVYADRNLRLTFAELEAEARLIARGLMACGVEQGERVALWATNVPEWIVLQFALAKIGAILVTVNTSLRAHEMDYLLRQSESATVIIIRGFRDVDYVGALREIGAVGDKKLPNLKRAIFISRSDDDDCPDELTPYEKLRELAAGVSEEQLNAREREVGLDDVINMQYTSGTTGFPKGVMLSSRNILNNGYWLGRGLGYTPQDRLCLCVPLFHCFGCVIGVLGAYTHGACLAPIESFDARKVLETVEGERCTSLYGVPTMFLAEMEDPEFKRFNLSSLRTGVMAGALCPEALMRRAIDEMNLGEITIIYGLTEASPGITQTPRDDTIEHRTQTVGVVLPEMEVRIVDPATRETLGANEHGELIVRGYNVMKGYYNNPDATRAAIDDEGWLRTGDQAAMDSDGYVRITGRIKDIIIRGGENISPKEIEDLMRRHPSVSDVYVYAVKSEFFGEEVAAAVKLKAGAKATEEELREFCQGRVARFKIPKYVRFVGEFPMTASGKIQKFKLRESHEKELAKSIAEA